MITLNAQSPAALVTGVTPGARLIDDFDSVPLTPGEKIGDVRVVALTRNLVELRTLGQLGWGLGLVGAVPIAWCALAWILCLKERLLAERLPGCLALTIMAVVSAVLMISSMAVTWRFDGRRKRISQNVGPFLRLCNARRLAGVSIESTRVGVASFADRMLFLNLIDATGKAVLTIGQWNRREVDRAKVEAIADAIRTLMGWNEPEPAEESPATSNT